MKVLVAGATGVLGRPTIRQLVAGGHEVFGLTRSRSKGPLVAALGATPVYGDVLDRTATDEAVAQTQPDGVVQLLNALPKRGPLRAKELDGTNELRVTGTRHLLGAAVTRGARRFVAESMILGYGYSEGDRLTTEEDRFPIPAPIPEVQPALDALKSLEEQILEATGAGRIEGVALRMGLFYGAGVGSTEFMAKLLRWRMFALPGGGKGTGSFIHVEDGASAVVAALERSAPGEIYNVADDHPVSLKEFATALARARGLPPPYSVPLWVARIGGRYGTLVATSTLRVSNDKIKKELGWAPRYPTIEEGLAARELPTASPND
jgi:nucleoside-diphosphate-sugar epimerase